MRRPIMADVVHFRILWKHENNGTACGEYGIAFSYWKRVTCQKCITIMRESE